MAPKRSRTSSSYDADKFVSAVTSNRYDQSLIKKVPITERWFSIQEGDFPDFDRIICERGWTQFCKQSQAAIIPLVQEFYANAYEHQGNIVRVWGKQVRFDCKTLNQYYALYDIKFDEYSAYVRDHVDLTEVADTIY